jgi:lysophospholipase L1-like esterase
MDRRLLLVVLAGCGGGSASSDDGGDDPPDAEPAVVAEIHRVGRFDGQDRFAFPGSELRTRFDGTALSVRLDESGANHYDVRVDGTVSLLVTSAGERDYVLANGLSDGEHDVIVTRRSESFFGTTTFLGFSGAPLVATAGPTRRIEMVGDSITCGYGVLGDVATCPFSIDTEAETHAWGALAAAELGAVHTAIAYSGKGVYRNYGGNMDDPMPEIFERTFADDPASQWTFATPAPDVVVINLGTNDFSTGDPGQPFVDAYEAMVAQIRGHYPAAWIVLAESPMLGGDHAAHAAHLAAVATASGGEAAKVTTLALEVQSAADGYGCDYHPNEVTQGKMATALVTKLRALLGW